MYLRLKFIAGPLSILLSCAAPVAAQWVNQPTAGIPRTADGKPNLDAPPPRTHHGTPDLSGVWQIGGFGHATNITDVEMLPWAQALYQQRLEAYGHNDPAVGCLPEGPRSGIAGLEPLRIVQSRNLIVVLYENGSVRQIHLDGRTHPHDPTPNWMGYSVGRWEGDTLVVETMGYNDKTWLDWSGHPHSEALRVTERFQRTTFGHMQLSMTFDDPKTYTKPWTIHMPVMFQADTDLIEAVCLENEKDRDKLIGRLHDERKADVTVARHVLEAYVGTYTGMLGSWQVSLHDDQLKVEMSSGGGRQPLVAQSDSAFLFRAVGGSMKFVRDADGAVSHFVLSVVEGDLPMMRQR